MDETSMNMGGGGFWIFALLILVFGMNGGGMFGNNNTKNVATQSDVVYTSAFNQLQDENSGIRAENQRTAYETMATTKDAAYTNLNTIRDVESAVNIGFANQQKCCCETLRAIDGVNYNNAINTAAINANTTAQTQKILDAMAANKIADLQSQVSELKTQAMLNGIPKISPFGYGVYSYPACSGGITSL